MKKKVSTIIILVIIIVSTIIVLATEFGTSDFLAGEKLGKVLAGVDDSVVATINGEEITSKEVSFLKYQYDNTTPVTNIDNSYKGIITKIAKDKLIIQEAKKIGIIISIDEKKAITERLNKSFDNNYEKNMEFIKGLKISREELIDQMLNQESIGILEAKYEMKFAQLLYDGTFTINDISLNKNINDFIVYSDNQKKNNTPNISEITERFQKLYSQYIDYIFSNSKFEMLE